MGQGPEAIKFYRRFLKDAPNAPNRAVAEKHIRDLEDSGTQPSPGTSPPATSSRPAPAAPAPVSLIPPTEPPPASPPAAGLNPLALTSTQVSTTPAVEIGTTSTPPESQPIYSKWWFWTGVGAVVVGGIILIAATAKHDPSCPGGFICQGTETLAGSLMGDSDRDSSDPVLQPALPGARHRLRASRCSGVLGCLAGHHRQRSADHDVQQGLVHELEPTRRASIFPRT